MLKKIFFNIVFQGSAMLFAQEGILKIEVSDKIDGAALEMANVLVESGELAVCKGVTDKDGKLVFKNLSAGAYTVKITYSGYSKNLITGVRVNSNATTYLPVELSSDNVIDDFVITDYKKPLINPGTVIKQIFDYEDIKRSALNPIDLLNNMGTQQGEAMTPSYRGARTTSNVYIIDGEKVIGTMGLPKSSIQQMSVTLGGVPAKYGDATGAFIEIETRSGLVPPQR